MSKINNSAGLASNQGVPSSIRLGIQNQRGMNEFSAVADADLADIAAYVNAVMYAKPLTDGTGAAAARPFVVWQNSSKIDIVAMPTILYGSAPTVRTTLLLQAPADGPLHVESMTINNPLFTLNRVAVAAIAGVQKVDTVALAGADNAACPVGAFDLLAGQACGVELVLAVNSPGVISAKLQITTVAGQNSIDLPIEATITAQAVGGAGGGGCTMRSTPSLFDPMLLLLSLLAFGVLVLRRKAKSAY
jgi:hypothetical protein